MNEQNNLLEQTHSDPVEILKKILEGIQQTLMEELIHPFI